MHYLIIYMSRHGTTQKVAEQLSNDLGKDNTRLINLVSDIVPPLDQYDTVLIGGSIYGGNIQQEVKSYCETHINQLLKKRLGLFMCSMSADKEQIEFENAFPAILRNHAIAHGLFGGELLIEKMSFIEKLIVRAITGNKESVSRINQDAIADFEKKMTV